MDDLLNALSSPDSGLSLQKRGELAACLRKTLHIPIRQVAAFANTPNFTYLNECETGTYLWTEWNLARYLDGIRQIVALREQLLCEIREVIERTRASGVR